MPYFIRESIGPAAVLSSRRPMVNDHYLSTYTLGVYVGCEFGCPYCDSWVHTPRTLDETIAVPVDLPQRLRSRLPAIAPGELIGITALSDPYQPAERVHRITRGVLEVLAEQARPALIMTKSPIVLDDLSLLQQMNRSSLALVMTTLLTTDPLLAGRLEARTPSPAARLAMIADLKRAGIPVGVALMPILPYINDNLLSLRTTLTAVARSGADFVVWDYLHMANARHRHRLHDVLARLGTYPPSYYRDIYQEQPTVSQRYREERDREIAAICDDLGLDIRAPHRIYAGKLAPHIEATLILRHAAFRDRVHDRVLLAAHHRELAAAVFDGTYDPADLRRSPLYSLLAPLCGG
jgi:DNA repair photolyase